MPYQKMTVGPSILRQPSQGDEGPAEIAIRRREKLRQEVVDAARDHAEGKISTEQHDAVLHRAHYRLNRDDIL
jgi:hypothetical protein